MVLVLLMIGLVRSCLGKVWRSERERSERERAKREREREKERDGDTTCVTLPGFEIKLFTNNCIFFSIFFNVVSV